jgi:hypothetical protein
MSVKGVMVVLRRAGPQGYILTITCHLIPRHHVFITTDLTSPTSQHYLIFSQPRARPVSSLVVNDPSSELLGMVAQSYLHD